MFARVTRSGHEPVPTLTTLNITVFCFLASYLVALGVEVARLWRPAKWQRNGMLFAGAAGLVAHSLYLIKRSQANGLPPLVGSAHDWLLVLAWLIVAGFLAAALLDRDVSLGVFALPLVLALVLTSYATGREAGDDPLVELGRRRWTMLHASGLAIGFASMAGAFLASVMYLVQHRRLRSPRHGHASWKMPSLESLASGTRWLVFAGFGFLTLGVVTGVILGLGPSARPSAAVFLDPQVLAGLTVWTLLAGGLVWLSTRPRSTGKQVAWLAATAGAVLLCTIVGLQAFTGRNHAGMHGGAPDSNATPAANTREVRP
jgi:ABC-type uncharacterized transport system permease subunit